MALEFNNDNFPRIPRIDIGNGGNENSENYDSNYAIAQEISSRIGVEPIPFNSVYDIALAIYRELGGEEEGFDSVYSILLGILPLVEGGGSGKAIEEVDTLPKASENKDKLFRLSSDGNVYVSELKSRTTITTNRLPDEQQIDKAYLYSSDDIPFYYKGAYKIICTDGEIEGYGWLEKYDNGDWYFILTKDNAVNITANTECSNGIISSYEYVDEIDEVNKIIIMDGDKEKWDFAGNTLSGEELIPISSIYNAPEANQIDNAYISSDDNIKFYYLGAETTIEVGGETINVYSWFKDGEGYVYSTKPASEIYYSASDEPNTPIMTDTKFYGGGEEWKIYVAHIVQLNAPEEQQIDNAFISYPEDETVSYTYGGVKTFNCTDGTLDLYEWEKDGYRLFTRIPASDLYEHAYEISEENITDVYTVDWSTYDIEATVAELQTLLDNTSWTEWNCTTEKYTREEVIEEWEWRLIPTVKEIPVEFGITVDASMKPTAITESSTGEYSADDMKDDSFNGAKVHARFAYETSQGGMTVTVLDYLEGVLNNEKIELTVGEQVISTEITPTMVFHKSNGSVWIVWYDNIHSSWKITVNQ